jgi:hypothetical protein
MPKFDGPIPGENYTADVKNFPWHRPPDQSDYVSTVEDAVKRITKPQTTGFIETVLSTGDTVLDVVTGLLRIGVGKGYYSIDNAVLAAGPMAKMVELVADEMGIDYQKGYDEGPRIMNSELMKALYGAPSDDADAEDEVAPEPQGGLMVMSDSDDSAPEDIQNQMLGYSDEETA